jgi:AAA15 family ATPase/GTPase
MLLSFSFKNFRSYRDEAVFSLETGTRLRRFKRENTHRTAFASVVKSAFLFGPNAGGKSNLLKAFSVLRSLVVCPTSDSAEALLWEPFCNSNNPTEFSVLFTKNGMLFEYTLHYTEKEVVYEQLSVNDKVVFQRDGQRVTSKEYSLLENSTTLRSNQLLLYWAQDLNLPEAVDAFSWFEEDIVDLTERLALDVQLSRNEAKILSDSAFKEKFLSILQAVDFNISDYIVSEDTALKRQKSSEQLLFQHKFDDTSLYLPVNRESTGIKRFVQLLLAILPEFASDKVILIDGFEQSFHIEMIKVLVNLMNKWNGNNQFIVTTHAFNVMDLFLRPDQIYFADKTPNGTSEVYSLFDFDDVAVTRSDFDYKKRYLKGMFAGMPIVNTTWLETIFEKGNRK